MPPPSTAELDRFRGVIERQLGLHFDADGQLQAVLNRRMAANRQNCETYLREVEFGPRAELTALSAELTVGETYFLRHPEQFQALVEDVVPERLASPGRPGGLRLLSAGCATGEEAYSLAIALREMAPAAAATASVLGIDLNPASLLKARSGRYTSWSMRSVPAPVLRRWFTTEGPDLVLDPELRDRVQFQPRNLSLDDAFFWQPERFDVVFCRNVLMYFSPEVMAATVRRIAGSLMPGGYLFLGSAETLRGLSDDFDLRESHGTFYYQLKSRANQDRTPRTIELDPGRESTSSVIPLTPGPRPSEPVSPPNLAPNRLEPVLSLLRQERFAEGLARIAQLPDAGRPDSDRLLLEAILRAHVGDLTGAERVGRRLLTETRLNAEAHALLAICQESRNDLHGGIGHCRSAIRIEPGFAGPHLQLGRLSQRIADLRTARHEYTEAARLLRTEDDYRILLFGGGFDREALISLCRTQSTRIATSR